MNNLNRYYQKQPQPFKIQDKERVQMFQNNHHHQGAHYSMDVQLCGGMSLVFIQHHMNWVIHLDACSCMLWTGKSILAFQNNS
jgi:hypothetical protein